MGSKKLNSLAVLIAAWTLVPSAVLLSNLGSSHLHGHESRIDWTNQTTDLPNRSDSVLTNTKQEFSENSDHQTLIIALEFASLLAQ